jgi:hypothetical protein
MKRLAFILILAVAVLLGFALAIGSTIGQGFISVGALAASAYATIEQAGSALTQRTVLNFLGSGVSCVDNSGASRTDCTINTGGGGGFIQSLTAPTSGSFTPLNFNVGATTTQVNNSSPVTSITLLQHDPGGTDNIAAIAKNIIASTYTVTIAMTATPTGSATQALAGLWLSDGGSPPNNLFFCYQNGVGIRIPVFSNFTTFASDVIASLPNPMANPLLWLRIQETASARTYFTSSDGITFAQMWTESNTAHFTTAQYGIGLENRAGTSAEPDVMMTMYSFTETNP